MLITLIRKEMTETMLDFRFVVATFLFMVLIPLGTLISCKDYEQRLAGVQREHQMYRDRYAKDVKYDTEAQGFRRPSVMSLFVNGLDAFVPDKVITSRSGIFQTATGTNIDNPLLLLFGKADFLFNVTFVVSLAALIFSFDTISGEKENGTLRLIIAHVVPRAQIVLSKVAGKYVTVLVPFLVSVLIALLILETSPDVSVGSYEVWPALLAILGVTLLFLLGMVCLGLCMSTFTSHAMGSMLWLFFVWVVFVLGIPKVSPMIAEVFCPVESVSVVSMAKRVARKNLEREYEQARQNLAKRFRDEAGSSVFMLGPGPEKEAVKRLGESQDIVEAKYEEERSPLAATYQRRITNRLREIDQDYRNRLGVQYALAGTLSRISPVSCYANIVSTLAGTGATSPDNFIRNAQRFQDDVKQSIYDKFMVRTECISGATYKRPVEGFDPMTTTIPDMVYSQPTLAQAVHACWLDIILLTLFVVVCVSLSFARFSRYDVR